LFWRARQVSGAVLFGFDRGAGRVAGRGAAAGVRARRPAGRATDREIAVVAAVLDAGSEKEAAHRLGLSHSTVKHHLANARSKVGATTTAQLVWILAARLRDPMAKRS
jgi:DNA-binding NarL/FixJ family response regulator